MKLTRMFNKFFVMMMILSLITPFAVSNANATVAYAATIKLNKTSISLDVGKTYTLKISGTKSKVTWSTSNKKVATVNSSGKVTAKKAGSATVTALVNKKKYNCKVTVKTPVNPLVKNAPFAAQDANLGKFNTVVPKDWTMDILAQENNDIIVMLYPSSADLASGSSNITILVQETDTATTYDIAKEYFASVLTEDLFISQFAENGIENITLSEFTTSDYETKNGTAFKTKYIADYKVAEQEGSFIQVLYDIYIDNYLVVVTITDAGDNLTPDIYEVTEYLLDALQLVK